MKYEFQEQFCCRIENSIQEALFQPKLTSYSQWTVICSSEYDFISHNHCEYDVFSAEKYELHMKQSGETDLKRSIFPDCFE
jgi:hypothetical protein